MTTMGLDARPHIAAVKAALRAAADSQHVYSFDEVPGSRLNADEDERRSPLPEIFWVITLERRTNQMVRANSRTGRVGWRLVVESVGTTVNEARWAMARAAACFNETRLTVVIDDTPVRTTRIQFESDDAPEPEGDRPTGRSAWTYTT